MSQKINLKDGDFCKVTGGTHAGKSGIVRDINTSKTGHVTITVVQKNGVRFKTLAKNVHIETESKERVPKPKKDLEADGDVRELYRKLVATNKKVELKGKTLPYTSVNGHMFSALYQDGTVGLRLPEKERSEFIRKYKTTQPVQHGTVLKEYAIVPLALLKNTSKLKTYFEKSFEYVQGLKAKK